MKRALKAALMSGLVFPGLGQLWLHRIGRGLLLVAAVLVAMSLVVWKATGEAVKILQRLEAEGGTTDLVAILNAATQASVTPDDAKSTVALWVLVAAWIAGVLDAYLVGRSMDRQEESREKREGMEPPSGGGGVL